ncbi:MAG: alpha-amylase family glycosyl hydrolase, partial [Telluria sp.]
IYGGQEGGFEKRLKFFEKDPIEWNNYPYASFYAGLLKLKHDNRALWNGQYGGPVKILETGNDHVFAFRREKDANTVSVTVNLTGVPQHYTLPGSPAKRTLAAWGYRIDAPTK